ncbi:MAG: LysE family translocator, partial [Pseudomonadota bacterium]
HTPPRPMGAGCRRGDAMLMELAPVAVGVLLAQASPGPNMMAVSAAALARGRLAAVATAAGIASGVFAWAMLFALGVGALLAAAPGLLITLKLLGGAYLTYLGLRALRAAWVGGATGTTGPVRRRAYLTGLLVVLTNPKAALMWVAVTAYVSSLQMSTLGFLGVGAAAAGSAFAIYGGYALLFSTGGAVRIYARAARGIEAGFGTVFAALGLRLVAGGLRDLRTAW